MLDLPVPPNRPWERLAEERREEKEWKDQLRREREASQSPSLSQSGGSFGGLQPGKKHRLSSVYDAGPQPGDSDPRMTRRHSKASSGSGSPPPRSSPLPDVPGMEDYEYDEV